MSGPLPPVSASVDTLFHMIGVGIPHYSARGLSCVVTPIQASKNLRRTVDGELRDTSYAQFHKYAITVSCKDQQPPALDGIWPGHSVTLWLPKWFSYPVGGTPSRQVVCGSDVVTSEGFVRYLPICYARIMDWSDGLDEWAHDETWSITFEEQ